MFGGLQREQRGAGRGLLGGVAWRRCLAALATKTTNVCAVAADEPDLYRAGGSTCWQGQADVTAYEYIPQSAYHPGIAWV